MRKGEDYYIVQRYKGCICAVRTPGIVYSCHVFLYKALVVIEETIGTHKHTILCGWL